MLPGNLQTREIERACRENVNFMYLLEAPPRPDHNTIARFRRNHLPYAVEDLLNQMVKLREWTAEKYLLRNPRVFIDGTKMEANANRYSFVWKTAVTKRQIKLGEKIASELPKLLEASGTGIVIPPRITVQRLKKVRKQLYCAKETGNVAFVRGKGHHKCGLQKAIEASTAGWNG
ncbi:MAG: transposase [Clostridia bacterium]